ncbi:hypothetical protein [Endozoicomonas arenosclerae]|uniref:hypothetical protein n=1 Tax=Endozoicomonas arenosclerae TaxID=1633495 RepID=UPI00078647F5|nr:hypothetical protein [Endozoicomonas arenosclerae]
MLKRLFASRKQPYLVNGDSWEKIRIDLSGNILTMELPPHHNSYGFGGNTTGGEKKPPERVNIYSPDNYLTNKDEEEAGMGWRSEGYAFQGLINRRWEFMGPIWRGRPLGSTRLVLMLCHNYTLPESMSFFTPSDLEKIVLRSAYFQAVRRIDLHQPKVPVNWRVIHNPLAPWVLYETHNSMKGDPETTQEFAHIKSTLIIPLAREYNLRLYFTYSGYTPVSLSLKHMHKIREQVIDSIQLDYTQEHLQQIQHLRTIMPDSSISETLEPMPWVFPEWREGDSGAGEPEFVITQPGTPAPTL